MAVASGMYHIVLVVSIDTRGVIGEAHSPLGDVLYKSLIDWDAALGPRGGVSLLLHGLLGVALCQRNSKACRHRPCGNVLLGIQVAWEAALGRLASSALL